MAHGHPVKGRPPQAVERAWTALGQARCRAKPRRALRVEGEVVGSVDEVHLPALDRWPGALSVDDRALTLRVPAGERDAWFAQANAVLHADGLIRGWRGEPFALPSPSSGRALAVIERASARFWGTLTLGAHANGWVAGTDGRPASLWVARRAANKPTDPGKLDNLVGGGVPHGQTPAQALMREGFEEAGLTPAQMARAVPGCVIELIRDVPEGLQFERLHVFDLALEPNERPVNQDGEVASIERMPIETVATLAAGDAMTVDASLVTLAFLRRYGLLGATGRGEALAAALDRLLTASV